MPGGVFGAGLGQHLVHGHLVLGPLLPVAPVLVGDLPLLLGGVLALGEAGQLGVLVDVDPEFDHHRAPVGQIALEFVDLVVGPLPVLLAAEALQPLHHHPAVPGAVEDADMTGARQARPEAPQVLAIQLVGQRRGDGMHVKAPGVQRIGHPADVAALARGVPALVAEDHGDLPPVEHVVQRAQPLLELLELLFILLVVDGGRQVHLGKLRNLHQREFLLEGLAHVAAIFEAPVDHVHQELHRVPHGGLALAAVQDVPGNDIAGLLHEAVVGLQEPLVLPVLPQVVQAHAPFGVRALGEAAQPLELLVLIDV